MRTLKILFLCGFLAQQVDANTDRAHQLDNMCKQHKYTIERKEKLYDYYQRIASHEYTFSHKTRDVLNVEAYNENIEPIQLASRRIDHTLKRFMMAKERADSLNLDIINSKIFLEDNCTVNIWRIY
jgi:dsDNA-specific endonuclease/ATPase MutS2